MQAEYTDMIQTLVEMIRKGQLRMGYRLVGFGKEGQGMMSALKMAVGEEVTEEEMGHVLERAYNLTPSGVRSKVVVAFDDSM